MDRILSSSSSTHHTCFQCISRHRCINSSLTAEQIDQLSNLYVKKITLKKGKNLYHNGDKLHSIYNIRAGILKSESSYADGRQQVIKFYSPGELAGLDGLQDGHHQTATTALTNSEVCCINYPQLLNAAKSYPALQANLDRLMSTLLNDTQAHIFLLACFNANEKLAQFLIEFSNKINALDVSSDEFHLPMNRGELSSYLGITIETLSRSFSYLINKKILAVRNKRIAVLQKDKLKSVFIHN